MTLIEDILVVLFGLSALYLVFYVWGSFFVRCTSDLKILHKCQRFPILGPLASRKLETIYRKQLRECTTAKEARRIKDIAWKNDLLSLQLPAYIKLDNLTFDEKMKALEEGIHDEANLLKALNEIDRSPCSGDDELYSYAMEALRPFTEKRIRGATTVKELVLLSGEKELLDFGFWKQGLDRIDENLKGLYANKLKELILREALAASHQGDVHNLCFTTKSKDNDINSLVAMKRNILRLIANRDLNSFWSADELKSEINFALMKFLEQ